MANQASDIKEMSFDGSSVAFDFEAFENGIRAHGISFIHYMALPDPIGLLDKNDSRRPNVTDNALRSNGFLYVKKGPIQALISGSTKEVKASSGGITDSGIAQITASCWYVSETEQQRVYLAPYDRLYLAQENILVTRHELVEASLSGVDQTKFPVVSVLALIDSDGNLYDSSSYDILQGKIHWRQGAKRPSFSPETNKGQVYTLKYEMKPYYYVQRMVHDLRLVQSLNDFGEREVKQAQQSAIVAREYLIDTLQPMSPGQAAQNNLEQPAQ